MLSSFDIVSVLSGRDPRLTRMIRPGPARPPVSATRLSDTTVGQVMHPRVITCLPDTPLHELAGRMATLMASHDAAHVVAVGHSGLPSGVVSTLDAIRILPAG